MNILNYLLNKTQDLDEYLIKKKLDKQSLEPFIGEFVSLIQKYTNQTNKLIKNKTRLNFIHEYKKLLSMLDLNFLISTIDISMVEFIQAEII